MNAESRDQYLRMVRENVEKFGWHDQGVFPTEDAPGNPFNYTVGLMENFTHPELLIVGIDPRLAHQLLSAAVERIRDGEAFTDGSETASLTEGATRVTFRALTPEQVAATMGLARRYYVGNDDVAALQVLLPDPNGYFPGEEGCDSDWAGLQSIDEIPESV